MHNNHALAVIWIGLNDIGDSISYFKTFPMGNSGRKKLTTCSKRAFIRPIRLDIKTLCLSTCLPWIVPLRTSKVQIDQWNALLVNYSSAFVEKHSNVTSMVYNANTFLNGVMDNPEKTNITNLGTTSSGVGES